MNCSSHQHGPSRNEGDGACPRKPWFKTIRGLATAGLLAILGYYLWTEHNAHVLAVLPFAAFLLCPLMHLFMPHDHGGHDHGERPAGPPSAREDTPPTDTKGPRP